MNVPQNDLDSLRALTLHVRGALWGALKDPTADRSRLIEEAARTCAEVDTRLDRLGARRPAHIPESAYAERRDLPLSLMDTPANRRYAKALREAWEAGLAVDRERYGEGIGTDGCAQVIEMVLADVEAEIGGPRGAIRE